MPPRGCVRRLERWLAAEGARLERVRYARPEARGEVDAWRVTPAEPRARVVAAHGAGNDALYPQIALFKALVRRGVEVFSFDADGHGAASTTVFSPEVVPSAIAAAVEEAERGRDDLPLHLLGHSFGGSLVLHALAAGSVPHAQSGIAISAPVGVALNLRVALGELGGFLRAATLGQREHYGVWGTVPAVGPLKRRAYPIRGAQDAGAPFAYVAAIRQLLARLDLPRTAGDVAAPVLLVYGTADRLVPPEQGRMLADLIPNSDLLEVPGATHWSTAFAEDALARAAAWIGAHPAVHA
ncbi:alpha/beta fold hydrolase [Longimicrobium sp.]|uniref:alpha/beta fold hydrolase n=1 Tax=Longimicrobium sp. TaxID=2029185 RepID=UPI002C022C61|nr:alpha/beta fold hydrolase [Longimicrobium sp.]HSU13885.1 alpha/beta fold hydrolase [Longimicrobium sp.]